MQRKLMIALAVMLGIFLVACGGGEAPAAPAEPTEAPAEPTEAPAEPTEAPAEEEMEEEGEMEEAPEEMMTMPSGELPEVDPFELEGNVVTAGSSTVFPLAERMAERFEDEGFDGEITVDSIGSGAGFERFCVEGETDVSNASRPIKDSEIESCEEIGRTPIEFRVGTDALAVVVSAENDFVEGLSMEQLNAAFSTAENWSDLDSSFPDEPILRYIPGTDSGTFDYFVEEVFEEDQEPILSANNLELSEDDNVLVQGVLGSPYAISFFGYAYYQENEGDLNALDIEGVEASAESVDAGDYPLARPLFIYSDAGIMQEKPQVAGYINFFLSTVNEEVVDVGYFPASDAALTNAKNAWLTANGFEVEGMEEGMMDEDESMDEGMMDEIMLPEVDPFELEGNVVTAGSSTVFPLAERMAERFEDEGFDGEITVDSIGSGAGFERFCVEGETDVSNASRPIKDSEIESCEEIGRTPIEFRVGTDALAVVVSAENDFVEGLSMEQLNAAFSTAENWSDLDSSFPDEPILRYIPGTDSGTFDYFVEEVFDEDQEPILSANNLELSEDDNVLVQGVLGSPYAISFFGYAYYQENEGDLNALDIEGVEASAESVDAGDYPLARPLFIYSDAGIMQEKPQVAGYINFFLSTVNEEVVDVGYFPASDAALNAAKQAWLDANN